MLFSEPERAAFRALLTLGFKDSFRLFEQPEKSFSWWDYRMNAFKRNLGLRIDHILVSDALAAQREGQPHRQEHASAGETVGPRAGCHRISVTSERALTYSPLAARL